LYYNTHGGTLTNIEGAMNALDLSLDSFDAGMVTSHGSSGRRARALIEAGHVDWICSSYDVIIICDTIPHGRSILLSLLEEEPSRRCQSKVVVEMTNRFDWEAPAKTTDFISRQHYCGKIYSKLANRYHVPINIVPAAAHYGGPKNLLSFKGFIDFPYQYSVMKFYENIAYGVPQFVPTPRLLEELLWSGDHCSSWVSVHLLKTMDRKSPKKFSDSANPLFPSWAQLMDFYNPIFTPYVYYFDSLQELADLNPKATINDLDTRNIRKEGRLFYIKFREELLQGWVELFHDMGFSGVKIHNHIQS
ncbi:UNVERIFIED_CONTAM: hypothetical protein HDU68_009810, partial [Siphonaria sp. JEL0065]